MLVLTSFLITDQLWSPCSAARPTASARIFTYKWKGPGNRRTINPMPKISNLKSFIRQWFPKSKPAFFVNWVPTTPAPVNNETPTVIMMPSGSGFYPQPPNNNNGQGVMRPINSYYIPDETQGSDSLPSFMGVYPDSIFPQQYLSTQNGISSYTSYSDSENYMINQNQIQPVPSNHISSVSIYGTSGKVQSNEFLPCRHSNNFRPSLLLEVSGDNLQSGHTTHNTYVRPTYELAGSLGLNYGVMDQLSDESRYPATNLLPPPQTNKFHSVPNNYGYHTIAISGGHNNNLYGSNGHINLSNNYNGLHQQELEGNSQLLSVTSGFDAFSGSTSGHPFSAAPLHAASILAHPRQYRSLQASRFGFPSGTSSGNVILVPVYSRSPKQEQQSAFLPMYPLAQQEIPKSAWRPTINWRLMNRI